MRCKFIIPTVIFYLALNSYAGFFNILSDKKVSPCISQAAAIASRVKMDCREDSGGTDCELLGYIVAKKYDSVTCLQIDKKFRQITGNVTPDKTSRSPASSDAEKIDSANRDAESEDEDAG